MRDTISYLRLSKVIFVKSFMFALCGFFHASQAADDISDIDPSWQMLLQLDNDLFSGSDRDYTSGVRVGFVREVPLESARGQRMNKRARDGTREIQAWLQSLRIPDDEELRFAHGFGLTQLLFTPEDPTALSAPPGERPYAGWLGLEYSLHVKAERFVNSLTLTMGTTGENSWAQPSQDWVHRNISNSPIFQGWDSQVPNELTLNLHFDHKQKFYNLTRKLGRHLETDGYYEGGFALGNFRTDAYIGAVGRIGYRLPSNFSTPRVQLGAYGHKLFDNDRDYGKKFSAYAFGGMRATGVAHDITLDGTVFRDFDTGVESNPLVGELVFGFGARYRGIDLVFSQTLRSDEFDGQTENLRFGTVMLRFDSKIR